MKRRCYPVLVKPFWIVVLILISLGCGKETLPEVKKREALVQPQNIDIQVELDAVRVSWSSVPDADGYFLEVSEGTTFGTIVAKTDTIRNTTTVRIEGLKPQTDYILRIRAVSLESPSLTSPQLFQPFKTNSEPLTAVKPHLVVAQDGSGDFTTVQAAIDAAPADRTQYYIIYIKKGVYKELIEVPRNKPNIYLIGEDVQQTILTYDNHSGKPKPGGGSYGTSDSRSVYVRGDNFVAEHLTFENTAGIDAGQALAINIEAPRSSFRDCRFLGHQDTWYAGNGTYQYVKDCYIEGSVDFIFGGSTAFFDNCQIVSTRGGYVTAASTPETQSYGYVFNRCVLTARVGVSDNSVHLGRPWRPYSHVVYLECRMGRHIRSEGWHNWGNSDNELTAFYAEYNTVGDGANPQLRVSWSHQLTETEVNSYTFEKVIGTYHPLFLADVYDIEL